MTVIAAKNGIMVADGGAFSGGVRYLCSYPKVARSPSGELAGATGDAGECYAFNAWVMAGMKQDEKPEFRGKGDGEIACLLLRTDGTIWRSESDLRFHPVRHPYALGESAAAAYCEAAMDAGLSAADAMALTIQNCIWVGGKVQVERLIPADASEFVEVTADDLRHPLAGVPGANRRVAHWLSR